MKVRRFGLLMVDPARRDVQGRAVQRRGADARARPLHAAGRGGPRSSPWARPAEEVTVLSSLWLDYDDFRMTDLALLYDLSQAQRDAIESLRVGEQRIIPFFLQANVDTLPDAVKAGAYAGRSRPLRRSWQHSTRARSG